MAGRLRTQLKKLEAIREAADALYTLIHEAVPKDLITTKARLERIYFGPPADEKAEHWHKMRDGAFDCSDSAMQLEDLLDDRIRKLPTYRPPVIRSRGPLQTPPRHRQCPKPAGNSYASANARAASSFAIAALAPSSKMRRGPFLARRRGRKCFNVLW